MIDCIIHKSDEDIKVYKSGDDDLEKGIRIQDLTKKDLLDVIVELCRQRKELITSSNNMKLKPFGLTIQEVKEDE